ncbi:MAG TPA: type II secretion system protein GspG [Myxococcota bacterium]|nr:type II secretion system protein GspG [Myxococcota bacterium]HRY93135.1 type II secretion system protein GspG [Myxococcota bacterium]
MKLGMAILVCLASSSALADQAGDLARSRVDHTRVVLAQVRSALDLYMVQKGSYPTTEQGLKLLVDEKILAGEPKDAWGNALRYQRSDPSTCVLESLGRDGKPGGSGEDADLAAD